MTWERRGKYSWRCGEYTICACYCSSAWVFCLFVGANELLCDVSSENLKNYAKIHSRRLQVAPRG